MNAYIVTFTNPRNYNDGESCRVYAESLREAQKIGRQMAREERKTTPGYKFAGAYRDR